MHCTGCSLEPVDPTLHFPQLKSKTCWTNHQHGDRTALLSGGHMPPCGMPIDSPHESCIRRKRELLRGATAPKPGQGFWMGVLPPQGDPTPSQRNLAHACLFATPAFWVQFPRGWESWHLCVHAAPMGAGTEPTGSCDTQHTPCQALKPSWQLWLFCGFATWLTVG